MYCPYCGSEIRKEYVYCCSCGKKLPAVDVLEKGKNDIEKNSESEILANSFSPNSESGFVSRKFKCEVSNEGSVYLLSDGKGNETKENDLLKSKDLRKYWYLYRSAPTVIQICVGIWFIWVVVDAIRRVAIDGNHAVMLYTAFNICAIAGVLRHSKRWLQGYIWSTLLLLLLMVIVCWAVDVLATALMLVSVHLVMLLICVVPMYVVATGRRWFDSHGDMSGFRDIVMPIFVSLLLIPIVGLVFAAKENNANKLGIAQSCQIVLPANFDEGDLKKALAAYKNVDFAYRMKIGKSISDVVSVAAMDVLAAKGYVRHYIFKVGKDTYEVPADVVNTFCAAAEKAKTVIEPVYLLRVDGVIKEVPKSQVVEYLRGLRK